MIELIEVRCRRLVRHMRRAERNIGEERAFTAGANEIYGLVGNTIGQVIMSPGIKTVS